MNCGARREVYPVSPLVVGADQLAQPGDSAWHVERGVAVRERQLVALQLARAAERDVADLADLSGLKLGEGAPLDHRGAEQQLAVEVHDLLLGRDLAGLVVDERVARRHAAGRRGRAARRA